MMVSVRTVWFWLDFVKFESMQKGEAPDQRRLPLGKNSILLISADEKGQVAAVAGQEAGSFPAGEVEPREGEDGEEG